MTNIHPRLRAIKLPKKIKLRTYIALGLLVILLPIVAVSLFKPSSSEAGWFDPGYAYRKRIDVANASGGALSDFQTKIVMDTNALVTAGKMQSDCDDVRVTDANGKTLPFWIEEGDFMCNETDTNIWVKIPSIPTTGATVYVYYGNPSATNGQNPEETFMLFDTFSGTAIDTAKWGVQDGGGSAAVSGGKVTFTSGANDHSYWLYSRQTFTNPVLLEARTGSATTGNTVIRMGQSTATTQKANENYYPNYSIDHFCCSALFRLVLDTAATGAVVSSSAISYPSSSVWGISWVATGNQKTFINYSASVSGTDSTNTIGSLYMYLGIAQSASGSRDVEWAKVRKYSATEPSAAVASEETTPGPIGEWKFDEGAFNTCPSGGDVCDSSDNKNEGVETGTPLWRDGDLCKSGKCLDFDGTADYISVTDSDTLEPQNLSVSAWIKPGSTLSGASTMKGFVIKNNNNSNITGKGYYLGYSGGSVAFWTAESTAWRGATYATSLLSGSWYHLEGTYDGTTYRLYINGAEVTTTVYSNAITYDNSSLTIGRSINNSGTIYFDGVIDEVKIYPYARSAGQVFADAIGAAAVLGASNSNLSNGLIGYWKFDETSGNAADSSSLPFTLTNNGTATYVGGKYANAAEFVPASNQYFSTASTLTGIKSVAFWVNPDSNTNYYMNLNASTYISSSSGTLSATGFSLPKYYVNGVETQTITADVWQHVVVTSETAITTSNQFYIGRASSSYMDGTIDEARAWMRYLSPGEVVDLYNLSPGPVGYWKLEEGTGTSVADSSSSGITGTLTNSPIWVQGKYGSAVNFSGSTQHIDFGDVSSVIGANSSGTVELWFKRPAVGINKPLFYYGDSGTVNHLFRMQFSSNNTLEILLKTTSTLFRASYDLGAASSDGTWNHIAFRVSSTGNAFFVNGSPVTLTYVTGDSTTASWFDDISSEDKLIIGGENISGTVNSMDGAIDDVRIYNYARTNEQILQDMAGFSSLASGNVLPDPIVFYALDEQQGQTINNESKLTSSFNGTRGANATATTDDPTWKTKADCKIQGCLLFDGSADYVDVGTGPTTVNAVSFWVNPTTTTEYPIDINGTAYVWINSGTVTAQGFTTPTIYVNGKQTSTIAAGVWSHVLVTTQTSLSASDFDIGRVESVGYHEGSIDHVRLYNVPLSQDQVFQDLNAGSSVDFGVTAASEASQLADGAGNPPVAYWTMDEKQDNTCTGGANDVCDRSGNAIDGAITNATWTRGKVGNALNFDASGDYVQSGDASALDISGTSPITFSTWIKLSAIPGSSYSCPVMLTETGYSSTTLDKGFMIDNVGRLSFYVWDGAQERTTYTTGLQANTWYHITGIFVGANSTQLWVNGQLVATGTTAASTYNFTSPQLVLGQKGGVSCASDFNGQIDDLKIYDYARTASQIAYDYNRGEPIAHWRLDECQGSTAYDASGNGLNGTITAGDTSGTNDSVGTCAGAAGEMWADGSDGKFSSSLEFDGTNDYVSLPASLAVTNDYSFSAWVKTSSESIGQVVGKDSGSAGTSRQWQFRVDSAGTVRLIRFDSSGDIIEGIATTRTVNDGDWHHITATFSTASGSVIYIDGISAATSANTTANGGAITAELPLVGARASSSPTELFAGLIDEVRIYNYSLSAAQVKKLYNGGASVNFSE